MSCFYHLSRTLRAARRVAFVACTTLAAGTVTAQPTVELAAQPPKSGFRIDGLADGDLLGINSDALGDFNGDGLDDFLVSAEEAQGGRGSTYVIFGRRNGFPDGATPSELDGSNGFRLDGAPYEGFNHRARGAGDVNGDGRNNLIIGLSSSNGFDGRACIVYGRAPNLGTHIALAALDGTQGFRIDGAAADDRFGISVGSGDFNGDGRADLIAGAERPGTPGAMQGAAYVMFGTGQRQQTLLSVTMVNGQRGFAVHDATSYEFLGRSVGSTDVNHDGVDDVLVGTLQNHAYVVFGATASPVATDLATLKGANGFRVDGEILGDRAGESIAGIGDVNGDGIDDFARNGPRVASLQLGTMPFDDGITYVGTSAEDYCGLNIGRGIKTASPICS